MHCLQRGTILLTNSRASCPEPNVFILRPPAHMHLSLVLSWVWEIMRPLICLYVLPRVCSMGDHDFVKPLLEEIGTVVFGRVLMKPGKPMVFATVNKVPECWRCTLFPLLAVTSTPGPVPSPIPHW